MIEPGLKYVIYFYLSFNLSDNNLEVSNKIKYLWHDDDDDDIHKRHKMCAQVCSVCSDGDVSALSIQNTIIYSTLMNKQHHLD